MRQGKAGMYFDILMVYLKRTLTGPACFFRSVSGVIPALCEATLESANGPHKRTLHIAKTSRDLINAPPTGRWLWKENAVFTRGNGRTLASEALGTE